MIALYWLAFQSTSHKDLHDTAKFDHQRGRHARCSVRILGHILPTIVHRGQYVQDTSSSLRHVGDSVDCCSSRYQDGIPTGTCFHYQTSATIHATSYFWEVQQERRKKEETLFDPKSTNVQITIPHISQYNGDLVDSFLKLVPGMDRMVMRDALNDYASVDKEDLLDVMDR